MLKYEVRIQDARYADGSVAAILIPFLMLNEESKGLIQAGLEANDLYFHVKWNVVGKKCTLHLASQETDAPVAHIAKVPAQSGITSFVYSSCFSESNENMTTFDSGEELQSFVAANFPGYENRIAFNS